MAQSVETDNQGDAAHATGPDSPTSAGRSRSDGSDGRADLHSHTTHSDGALTPLELVRKAHAAGLSALAITDHDNVGAIDEATEWGKRSEERRVGKECRSRWSPYH